MVENNFKNAIANVGLSTRDTIIPDGKLHRFHVNGDRHASKNGWYVLFNDDVPAGRFGCWKRGINQTWCDKAYKDLTATQRAKNKHRMIKARKSREVEEQALRKAARGKALYIWNASSPAPNNHPYLIKKNVKSYDLRTYNNSLVIPLLDNARTIHSLQFIDVKGNKRFLSGGRKKGCYFSFGLPVEPFCIAEGYATAASIYEANLYPVVVAFDAGNLKPTAQAIYTKFSQPDIIVCGDNDTKTPGNPGLTKAKEAAAAVGGSYIVPPCHGDFNDFYTGVQNNA